MFRYAFAPPPTHFFFLILLYIMLQHSPLILAFFLPLSLSHSLSQGQSRVALSLTG